MQSACWGEGRPRQNPPRRTASTASRVVDPRPARPLLAFALGGDEQPAIRSNDSAHRSWWGLTHRNHDLECSSRREERWHDGSGTYDARLCEPRRITGTTRSTSRRFREKNQMTRSPRRDHIQPVAIGHAKPRQTAPSESMVFRGCLASSMSGCVIQPSSRVGPSYRRCRSGIGLHIPTRFATAVGPSAVLAGSLSPNRWPFLIETTRIGSREPGDQALGLMATALRITA